MPHYHLIFILESRVWILDQASTQTRIIISVLSSGTDAKCTFGAKRHCAKYTKATFKPCKLVLDLLSILKAIIRIMNPHFNKWEEKTHFIFYISINSLFNCSNCPNMLTFLRTPSWVLDSLSKTGGRNLDIIFCNCSSVSAWPSRKKTRSSWSII